MANKTKKSEGPSCACGKGDLYEDWMKLHPNKEEKGSDSTTSDQAVDNNSFADETGKKDHKRVKTKK
jgi:uncharacterized protein (DUF983 family)